MPDAPTHALFMVAVGDPLDPGATPPTSGQVVRLTAARRGELLAFPLTRPDAPWDNAVWTEADFAYVEAFGPRWKGFEDLVESPRVCHGRLKTASLLGAICEAVLYPVITDPNARIVTVAPQVESWAGMGGGREDD